MTAAQLAKLKGQTVEVKWGDAHSLDPWTNLTEFTADDMVALPCQTYGIVIGTSKEGMMVAGSINAAGCAGASWFIPIGMITDVTILDGKDSHEAQRSPRPGRSGGPHPVGDSRAGRRRSRRYLRWWAARSA